MRRIIVGVLFSLSLAVGIPVGSSYAEAQSSVCGTGPYVFATTSTGILPSVGKRIAALGLMAKNGNCASFKVVCAVRPSTDAEDKKNATYEVNKVCGAIRAKLLVNMRSRNTAIAGSLNSAARKEVEIVRQPASETLTLGTALVYVKP